MEREVKSLKKSLDVLAKRKVNYKTNRFLNEKLGEETEFLKVPTYNYHKNVTKVSRESDNRRSMMYPVCKLNTLVHFTNKAGDTPSAFTIKWYEDKLVREAGIYGVYIYADPEESEDIYFITIYSLLIGGKPTKSLKTTITKFNFDNNEVVKMGDTTTLSESLKSVGFVLLHMFDQYNNMIQYNKNTFENFEDFFINDCPDGEQEKADKLNMNIFNMLNTEEEIEDEDLLIYKSM